MDKTVKNNKEDIVSFPQSVHNWFELSYAQYLTIPRCVLEAMSEEWQERFIKCLEELDNTIDWRPKEGRYHVKLKDSEGRFVHDPLMEYRHRQIEDIPFRK
jgi:hypothetical protein